MTTKEDAETTATLLSESFSRIAMEGGAGQLTELVHPEVAIEALFLRSSGATVGEVKERTGIHHVTLKGLEERHRDVLTLLKRRAAVAVALTAAKAVELTSRKLKQLDDDPEALAKTGIKDISLSAAILIDKARLLASEPTSIIENRNSPSREEYREFLRKAQGRAARNLLVTGGP
jgi:hypothetical protein